MNDRTDENRGESERTIYRHKRAGHRWGTSDNHKRGKLREDQVKEVRLIGGKKQKNWFISCCLLYVLSTFHKFCQQKNVSPVPTCCHCICHQNIWRKTNKISLIIKNWQTIKKKYMIFHKRHTCICTGVQDVFSIFNLSCLTVWQ